MNVLENAAGECLLYKMKLQEFILSALKPLLQCTHNSDVSESGFATFRDGSSRGTSHTPIRKVILLGNQVQAKATFSPGYTIL